MSTLDVVMDVFRLRQVFGLGARALDVMEDAAGDLAFLDAVRRVAVPLPGERRAVVDAPFQTAPRPRRGEQPDLRGERVGIAATGGSGALASVIGVARAIEECGARPAVISMCSGSALFGFPLGAGLSAAETADFVLGLDPRDYVAPDWWALARLLPTLGRGVTGLMAGDRLEAVYRRRFGEMALGDLPIPVYAPIWNIEENRVEFLGPKTYPDVTVARAVRMAVALPLFFQPVPLGPGSWCDGGIVDIFPVAPLLDIEPRCDLVVAVNGFYPPRFEGEPAPTWQEQTATILRIAAQVRSCQHVQLARDHLRALEEATDVVMVDPVPFEKVRGIGFYREFIDQREWPSFMRAGRTSTLAALRRRETRLTRAS